MAQTRESLDYISLDSGHWQLRRFRLEKNPITGVWDCIVQLSLGNELDAEKTLLPVEVLLKLMNAQEV